MVIEPKIKDKIQRVLCAFETGHQMADYSALVVAHDGPGDIAQISYGKMQTTEFSTLKDLVQMYVNAHGKYYSQLKPYIDKIGKESLAADALFINYLKYAAQTDEIMWDCQDILFDTKYWKPMIEWATRHGFTSNLSALVLFDSFIQSGYIFWFLRNEFSELPPSQGGDEKKWIANYVMARKKWMEGNDDPEIRDSAYRINTILEVLNNQDWDLKDPIMANGNKIV